MIEKKADLFFGIIISILVIRLTIRNIFKIRYPDEK